MKDWKVRFNEHFWGEFNKEWVENDNPGKAYKVMQRFIQRMREEAYEEAIEDIEELMLEIDRKTNTVVEANAFPIKLLKGIRKLKKEGK